MELRHVLAVAWRWWWLLALAIVLPAALSYQVSARLPRLYGSSTTLMVGQLLQQNDPNAGDFTTTQQLAQTYVLLVRRQPLLEATAQELGLDIPWTVLANQVNATAVPQTQLIQISVVDGDPERARRIADALAHQLILQSPTPTEKQQDQRDEFVTEQLSVLQTRISQAEDQLKGLEDRLTIETSARGVTDVQSQISGLQQKITSWQTTYAGLLNNKIGRVNALVLVEPASASPVPVSPNVLLNAEIAAAVGLALAIVAILVLEYLDDTLKRAEDVNRVLKLPTLGVVGRIRGMGRRSVGATVALSDRMSATAEAFRLVRTNIQFARLRHGPRLILVTSATAGEGKTTTLSNLAIAMAEAGARVIICDADLRSPSVHHFFGVPRQPGLTSLLLNETMATEEAMYETGVPGLLVLPSGPIPANPAELLGCEPMQERVRELKAMADVVLFDSPATLPVADPSIIGSFCDGAIIVVDASRTRSELVRQAKATLEQVGVTIWGVVLNRAKVRTAGYYSTDVEVALSHHRAHGLAAIWSSVFGTTH
jgi:non-specific protein-tyrosine kinase